MSVVLSRQPVAAPARNELRPAAGFDKCDQIANLFGRESVEQSLGHEGDGRYLLFLDRPLVDFGDLERTLRIDYEH